MIIFDKIRRYLRKEKTLRLLDIAIREWDNYTHSIGLCFYFHNLYSNSVYTCKEYQFISDYLQQHKPEGTSRVFWWNAGKETVRLDFLKKLRFDIDKKPYTRSTLELSKMLLDKIRVQYDKYGLCHNVSVMKHCKVISCEEKYILNRCIFDNRPDIDAEITFLPSGICSNYFWKPELLKVREEFMCDLIHKLDV